MILSKHLLNGYQYCYIRRGSAFVLKGLREKKRKQTTDFLQGDILYIKIKINVLDCNHKYVKV